jgi:hypothetical protein
VKFLKTAVAATMVDCKAKPPKSNTLKNKKKPENPCIYLKVNLAIRFGFRKLEQPTTEVAAMNITHDFDI